MSTTNAKENATAAQRGKTELDWMAISRSFNAKQRREWRAFYERIAILVDGIEHDAAILGGAFGENHTLRTRRLADRARRLKSEINSIPLM